MLPAYLQKARIRKSFAWETDEIGRVVKMLESAEARIIRGFVSRDLQGTQEFCSKKLRFELHEFELNRVNFS